MMTNAVSYGERVLNDLMNRVHNPRNTDCFFELVISQQSLDRALKDLGSVEQAQSGDVLLDCVITIDPDMISESYRIVKHERD